MADNEFDAEDMEEVTLGVDSDIVAQIRADIASRTAADDLRVWTDPDSGDPEAKPADSGESGDASMIGESAPPPVTVDYWQSGSFGEDAPVSAPVSNRKRKRVPLWLIMLIVAVLIVVVSVAAAATLVAAADAGPVLGPQ